MNLLKLINFRRNDNNNFILYIFYFKCLKIHFIVMYIFFLANSHQISSHIRKSFKSLKTSQEFNKQSEISKNNLTNRGNNMVRCWPRSKLSVFTNDNVLLYFRRKHR